MHSQQKSFRPLIAVVTRSTPEAVGMAELIRRVMPGADTVTFATVAALSLRQDVDRFYHYFVAAEEVITDAPFFIKRQQKTIVLIDGDDSGHLPGAFHCLNICRDERTLIDSMVILARRSHTVRGIEPDAVRRAREEGACHPSPDEPHLTPREREVLKGIVEGFLNKEIADRMGVGLATVITHRKNLTDKLGTRSVAALTIYAVTHGIVKLPMIR